MTNPGPVMYPRTICGENARANHRALQCDARQLWSHASCVHVKDGLYRELQAKVQFSWHCPLCLFAVLPTTEVDECGMQSTVEPCDSDSIPFTVDELEEEFSGIRVIHHNVQGLHSELAQWFECCRDRDVVLCFSELWVRPDTPPVDVPGFQLLMSPFHCHPGMCTTSYLSGSCIYISDSLSVGRNSLCTDIESSCKLLNVTCCMFYCKFTKVAVVSVYRSSSISYNDCLIKITDMFTQLLNITSNVIIVGNFNFDLLSSYIILKHYVDILSDFNFIQHIVDPCRAVNQSATLINHVLTAPKVEVLKVTQTMGLSDHQCKVLEVDISVTYPVEYTLRVLSFRKCPWDEVRCSLCIVPWQVMDIYDNVDDMWSFFYGTLHDCLDTFAPVKSINYSTRSHCPTPWLSLPFLQEIKRKR